ncbi:dienelactone hydrolase family protein [Methylobacterium sp. 17Sr1-1]|uniref:dienelactone hydrolase family protein n=1 Tax=Methylobacterium sp. 17Sr1-1 TaxID=2202826 RepID=UPI000D6FC93B|nr:dienelactone hydrolase family protein [Methylobacterium sp. 17Sr1-1]AWN51067.1 dienelactone hydrolase [Methylobacterium sp. 17Sr1-1]
MLSFASGETDIEVEWFGAPDNGLSIAGPAVLLLHGADGLTFVDGYRFAARTIAASGYHVAFVHYLDRTGDRRVNYSRLRQDFPLWVGTVRDALSWLAQQPGVDAERLGIVGISLGAALALETAASDGRVRAIVDYFGPLPEDLAARRPRLPPTLILHGARDAIVPVSQAYSIERLLKEQGTPYEIQIYPDHGHGFTGVAQFDAAVRTARFLDRCLR